jgi:hypothetical protein
VIACPMTSVREEEMVEALRGQRPPWEGRAPALE